MNLTEEAKMIYQAQPTAYNARALQIALRLDARAEKLEWQPANTAPDGRPILATWETDDGRTVSGQVFKQIEFPSVDSDMEEALGMPSIIVTWSFDHDGEDILHYEPTHWMEIPEKPVKPTR
jgi:hypothetical protein